MFKRSTPRHSISTFGFAIATLTAVVSAAAPNYYSKGGSTEIAARISVNAPKGGKFEAGGSLNVSWTKQTEGTEVNVWLYTASGDGIRGDKVRGLVAPKGAEAAFTPRGGSFDWIIPEDVAPGRYVVVVSAGLDEATSPAFAITEPSLKLTAPRKESAGIVKIVTAEGKGRGAVKVTLPDRESEYLWGSGHCPSLVGGLPGALATLAALGNATIVPIVRDVIKRDKVEQTCLDGFVVLAPASPSAPTAPSN
jgi:hypothetical protein